VLDLQAGALTVRNVPVPRTHGSATLNALVEDVERLQTTALLGRFLPRSARQEDAATEGKTRQVLHAMLAELKRTNEAQGSRLVLLYIPLKRELSGSGADGWVPFVHEEAHRLGLPLVDLLETFRNLPYREVETLYIRPGQIDFPGASGHLTPEGNRQVAAALYPVLASQVITRR
jgi:hypothetical protein